MDFMMTTCCQKAELIPSPQSSDAQYPCQISMHAGLLCESREGLPVLNVGWQPLHIFKLC
jgi:hypothetical protein